MKSINKNTLTGWQFLLLGIAILLVFRLVLFNRFLLFTFLALCAIAILVFIVYQLIEYRRKAASLDEVDVMLAQRIDSCNDEIGQLEAELVKIEQTIQELEIELQNFEINSEALNRTVQLKKSFVEERDLRRKKIAFYQTSISHLKKWQYNHKLVRKLERKNTELKRLKSKNYEELGEMEAFKTEMKLELDALNSFDNLSLKLMNTESIRTTETLLRELESMKQEMDK